MNTRLVIAVAATIVLIAGIAIGFFLLTDAEEGPIIAIIDGYTVSETAAEARIAGFGAVHGDLEGAFGSDYRSVILQSLVDDVILYIEADTRGLDISEERIDEELSDVKRQVEASEDWEEWLTGNNASEDELRRRIRLQFLSTVVYNAVTESVELTEDDLIAYYEANPDQFEMSPGERRPFLEVRGSIEATLGKESRDLVYTTWLNQRRAEVEVEVVNDDWK